jgi:acyl-CoA synthetase (AMP-forming)/AMP-acid ligase II
MHGQMMDMPLLISSIIEHAARHHSDTEIVSRRVEGDIHRYTYSDCNKRSKQLANALGASGDTGMEWLSAYGVVLRGWWHGGRSSHD